MFECSFCHKKQDEVRVIVQGEDTCICDHCVWVCIRALVAPEIPKLMERVKAIEDKLDTTDRNTQGN